MRKIVSTFLLTVIVIAVYSQQPVNTPPQNNAVINNQPDRPVYRNMRTFTQNGIFQLPKGTTQVMIEAWGAGGGGSNTGGGGGGAYGKTVFAVVDGGSVTVTIGLGGKGGTYQATPGGNTYAQFRGAMIGATGVSLSVDGGKGAGYIVGSGGAADQGEGGADASINSGSAGFYSVCGEDGETYIDDYQQSGQNSFVVTRHIGKGGNAGNTFYTGGRGDVVVNPASPGTNVMAPKENRPAVVVAAVYFQSVVIKAPTVWLSFTFKKK